MWSKTRLAILVFSCFVVAGCATSRSEIKLSGPALTGGTAPAPTVAGRTCSSRAVTDGRKFEEALSDPSTPSLGFEGASKSSAEVKAHAIGRKRNLYGKALGDVLLESGQTVEGVVGEHVTIAMQQAGYQIKPSLAEAGDSPWSWMSGSRSSGRGCDRDSGQSR